MDGDDTYPAEYAPEMARLVLEEQADMVVGDRLSSTYFTENKRPFHNFGNLLVRKSINALFGCQIKDMMTGYRAFSYQFVKTFPVLSRGFEIETEMSIHAAQHHMQIENVVVDYRDRPDGSVSKLNTYNDGIRVLFTILNLFRNYRPLFFFSLFGFMLATIAAGYMQTVGQKHVEPSRCAIIFSLESVFACLSSVVMGYEPLTPNLAIGGLIVVCSIMISEYQGKKKGDKEKPE